VFKRPPPEAVRSGASVKPNKINGLKIGDTNVKVINQAPYPQIVIIPHKSEGGNANNFNLQVGDQTIGFSNRKGNLENSEQKNNNNNVDFIIKNIKEEQFENNFAEVLRTSDFDQNSGNGNQGQVQIVINNQRRKAALIRASEKQNLMLSNLMDAMHRHKGHNDDHENGLKNSSSLEKHMEEVLKRQVNALEELKSNVINSDDSGEFTAERLTLLEDASHRQLEVLEDLVTAVQRLDKGNTEERLQNLETIAVHQNAMLEEMHEAMTKTTTTQNPASLKIKPPTAATPTLNSSSQ
jgi:hypothetical protein